MGYLDLEKFHATTAERRPFEFIIVPSFIKTETLKDINKDFPP
jgi:hypothetical protein